jgi:quercetin dioxygenase-like cupin family protein
MATLLDIDAQLADFGVRLHEFRSSRDWTLEELAERSGLSKAFLSRLEAGDRQPSIAAVLTLAKVFGVSVGAMFDADEPDSSCLVIRSGEVKVRRGDGLSYTPLSSTLRFTNLQPMKITVSRHRKGNEQFQHDGEEWLYLLSGRLRVTVAGVEHLLEPGDSAHFDSRQPHRLTAIGASDAELIMVACPLSESATNQSRPIRQRRAIP